MPEVLGVIYVIGVVLGVPIIMLVVLKQLREQIRRENTSTQYLLTSILKELRELQHQATRTTADGDDAAQNLPAETLGGEVIGPSEDSVPSEGDTADDALSKADAVAHLPVEPALTESDRTATDEWAFDESADSELEFVDALEEMSSPKSIHELTERLKATRPDTPTHRHSPNRLNRVDLKQRPKKRCSESGTGLSLAKNTFRPVYRWNTPSPASGCCALVS